MGQIFILGLAIRLFGLERVSAFVHGVFRYIDLVFDRERFCMYAGYEPPFSVGVVLYRGFSAILINWRRTGR